MMENKQENDSSGLIQKLGYDPQPHRTHWHGTPIPPVDRPLALTHERAEICGLVWWWGGPEIALRNCKHYLYHVIDYGRQIDQEFTMQDVSEDIWRYALNTARQGQVSRGGHRLFALFMNADFSVSADWPDNASRFDIRRNFTHAEWLERRVLEKRILSEL